MKKNPHSAFNQDRDYETAGRFIGLSVGRPHRTSPTLRAQDNKPWKNSTRFADLIDIPEGAGEMKKHIPDFEFQLVELFRMPFKKILGTPMGILTLRALKAEKLQALLDDSVWDESLLVQLSPACFEMLMRYILDRDLDKPAFRRKLQPESGD